MIDGYIVDVALPSRPKMNEATNTMAMIPIQVCVGTEVWSAPDVLEAPRGASSSSLVRET